MQSKVHHMCNNTLSTMLNWWKLQCSDTNPERAVTLKMKPSLLWKLKTLTLIYTIN